jgi:transcriptional regulator with XRE-family HTH domain
MNQPVDVRALRESLGWTQDQLAAELGLDRSSVSRLESGQKPKGPTAKMLEIIAERLRRRQAAMEESRRFEAERAGKTRDGAGQPEGER